MYMSYCRFEGTLYELRACMSVVDEHINEEAESAVSDNEIRCFKNMLREFTGWMQDNELLDENGELDEETLDSICSQMAISYQEED